MRTNTRIFPRIHPRLFERDASLAGFGLVDSGALLSFHAAWADAAGVNQPLLIGTGPVTTDHTSAIYALNSSGVYESFAADDPVWQYDADGDYLVAQDEGTNLFEYSNVASGWAVTGTATATQDQVGLDGSANTAVEVTTTSSANAVYGASTIGASIPYIPRIFMKAVSTSGEVRIAHSSGNSYGYWAVDLSLVSTTEFEQILPSHAAVTESYSFISTPSGGYMSIRIQGDGTSQTVVIGNIETYKDTTEEQIKSLGPIFTSGSTATSSELRNVYPAANHSNTEGPYYMEFENTGDDVVLMKAGTDEFLKITSNQLILDDGTTQISTACAAGEHKVGIAFSDEDSLMNLNLDDSWETQAAYDGTLGSGDISLGETCRNVKRWNETDFDKQKALIDKEMA